MRPRMSTGYWLCDWVSVSVSVSAAACSGLGVAPAMVAEPFADAPAAHPALAICPNAVVQESEKAD